MSGELRNEWRWFDTKKEMFQCRLVIGYRLQREQWSDICGYFLLFTFYFLLFTFYFLLFCTGSVRLQYDGLRLSVPGGDTTMGDGVV